MVHVELAAPCHVKVKFELHRKALESGIALPALDNICESESEI